MEIKRRYEIMLEIEKEFDISICRNPKDSSQFYIVYDGDMAGASDLTEKIEAKYPLFSMDAFDDGIAVTIYFSFEGGQNG